MGNTFRVIRHSNRRNEDFLLSDITGILNDPNAEFIDAYGLPADNSLVIYDMMLAVEKCFHQLSGVKSIGFEITLEDTDTVEAYNVMEELLSWIGSDFHVLGSVRDCNGDGLITILMHCVSYRNGSRFMDNNECMLNIVKYLEQLTGQKFSIKTGTLFSGTSADQNCYI